MNKNVIVWKLNELMAIKRVRNKELAKAIGVTENSVYRLRRTDRMPRLTPERLNSICTYLQCQPGDLLKWIPDELPQASVVDREKQNIEQKDPGLDKHKDKFSVEQIDTEKGKIVQITFKSA